MGLVSAIQGNRVYLDTNVFIYALEGFPPLDTELQDLFKAVGRGDFEGFSSELTLAEALVKPLKDGNTALIDAYDTTLQDRPYFHLLAITRAILREAAHLRGATSLKLPDAIHLATAKHAGCTTFVTNDTDFKGATSMKVVVLSELVTP